VPIVRKGQGKVRDYHANIVQNLCSLEEEVEVEKRGLIPPNQTNFILGGEWEC